MGDVLVCLTSVTACTVISYKDNVFSIFFSPPSTPTLHPGCNLQELLFDQVVSEVPVATLSQVSNLLRFQPPVPQGATAQGAWVNRSILIVTFDFSGAGVGWDASLWRVGSVAVSTLPTARLVSANNESEASNSSAVVDQGSWGDAPSAVAAVRTCCQRGSSIPVTTLPIDDFMLPAMPGLWSSGCVVVLLPCLTFVSPSPPPLFPSIR